jgi:hypothetical protein
VLSGVLIENMAFSKIRHFTLRGYKVKWGCSASIGPPRRVGNLYIFATSPNYLSGKSTRYGLACSLHSHRVVATPSVMV